MPAALAAACEVAEADDGDEEEPEVKLDALSVEAPAPGLVLER
jgi:hypothetical protein